MMTEGKTYCSQTLERSTVFTSLFLLPAYIICCSGLQPAIHKYVNINPVDKDSAENNMYSSYRMMYNVLTHWTGEDEAQGIGNTSIIMLVFITVDNKCSRY